MKTHHKSPALILTLCSGLAAIACNDGDEDTADPPWTTDEVGDTGETGGPNPFEPESEPPPPNQPDEALAPGECMAVAQDGLFGYVHQCEGTVTVSFDAQYLGNQYSGGDTIDFGPGVVEPDYWIEADSYENPRVAACCGPFDFESPTSEDKYPYAVNCLGDSVQSLCQALPTIIRKQGEEQGGLAKTALNNLADQIEAKENECIGELWGDGPGVVGGPDPYNELDPSSWAVNNNVTISLDFAGVYDWTEEGEVTWRSCNSIEDNDANSTPTAPFEIPGVVNGLNLPLLTGTTMTGTGPANALATITPDTSRSSLTLGQVTADASLAVTGLRLRGTPAPAVINGGTYIIDTSSVVMGQPVYPSEVSGLYTIPANTATFVATATFSGDSRQVYMTNDDPIVFRYDTSTASWEFDPFDLIYSEAGFGTWRLEFDGLSFDVPT